MAKKKNERRSRPSFSQIVFVGIAILVIASFLLTLVVTY